MTPFPILPIFIILFLLFSLPASSPSAVCSDLYGHPEQQACWQMLYGPYGIRSDAKSRLFSLVLPRRPPHISTTQWRLKQRLPFLRSNGGCKLALLAIQLVDHTITYDTTTWADIALSGSLIHNQCIILTEREGGLNIPSGGHVLTGDHRGLALILYASGSVYDQQVQSDLAHGRTVVAEQDLGDEDIEDPAYNTTTTISTLVNVLGAILPRAQNPATSSAPVNEAGSAPMRRSLPGSRQLLHRNQWLQMHRAAVDE